MTKKEVLEKYKGRYWHELSTKEMGELFDVECTYGDLVLWLEQPEWCNYPEALGGDYGCWSLLGTPEKICMDWCKTCDCCKE